MDNFEPKNINNLSEVCNKCDNKIKCLSQGYFCPGMFAYMTALADTVKLRSMLLDLDTEAFRDREVIEMFWNQKKRETLDLVDVLKGGIVYRQIESGEEIAHYVNLRYLLLNPINSNTITAAMLKKISRSYSKHLATIGDGGQILLSAIMAVSPFNNYRGTLFKEEVLNDKIKQEGFPVKNEEITLIDDVSYTGYNLIRLSRLIRAAGGRCGKALVVINRKKGNAVAHLRDEGIILKCLMEATF